MSLSPLPSLERIAPSRLPELMDDVECDTAALEGALDALARTNRLFGGRRLLWSGVWPLLADLPPGAVRLLDVGAGGGDMVAALRDRLVERGWSPSFVLGDLHPRTLDLARERLRREHPSEGGTGPPDAFRFTRLNAPELPFADGSFDVVFSSTTLHHLERPDAVTFVREMARVSRRGWVITDLRRSRLTYAAVRLLAATLWRDNPVPRRDGPVSVRRAFTTDELRGLIEDAGVRGRVGGGWPFRLRARALAARRSGRRVPGTERTRKTGSGPSDRRKTGPGGAEAAHATATGIPGGSPGSGPDSEVLVVGAGPAGSSLALRLARRGIRVELLDARAFPRSKPCGDCLSPGATPLLGELGVLPAIRARADHLRGWRMRAPDGTWFEGRFRHRPGRDAGRSAEAGGRSAEAGGPWGLALRREELDAILLGAARAGGARVRERTRVFDLLRSGDRVVGVRTRAADGEEIALRAPVVVGADGLRSVVARRLGGVRRGERGRLAIVGRFRSERREEAPAGREEERLGRMRISAEGCLGVAPAGGFRNVTLVVPLGEADAISRDRHRFYFERLARYGVASRFPSGRLAGELEITGPFEVEPRRVTAPGALLVGDAAGYFDPFTGQGIYRALASARLAAGVIPEMLASRSPSGVEEARERFERGLSGLLGASRRMQRWIDAVVRRPGLLNPLGRLLAARPGIASLIVDVTGDLLPPGAAGDPLRLGRALFRPRETHAYP